MTRFACRALFGFLIILGILSAGSLAAQCTKDELAILTASDSDFGDLYGSKVAMDGNIVAVGNYLDDEACGGASGCDSGAVYVYRFNGDDWVQGPGAVKDTPGSMVRTMPGSRTV